MCVQKGEIEGRGWTHWIDGDELHLVLQAGFAVFPLVMHFILHAIENGFETEPLRPSYDPLAILSRHTSSIDQSIYTAHVS